MVNFMGFTRSKEKISTEKSRWGVLVHVGTKYATFLPLYICNLLESPILYYSLDWFTSKQFYFFENIKISSRNIELKMTNFVLWSDRKWQICLSFVIATILRIYHWWQHVVGDRSKVFYINIHFKRFPDIPSFYTVWRDIQISVQHFHLTVSHSVGDFV